MPFVRSREDAEFVEQEMKLRRCFEVEYWGHETWFRIQPKNRDPQSLLCLAWFIEGMYHGMDRQPKGRDGMPLAKTFEDATFACPRERSERGMNEKKPNPPTDPRDGFTPGPWSVGDWGPEYVYGFDGVIVADCRGYEQRSVAESSANARLIASAPTLLADNERQAKVIEAMRGALDEARRELGNYKHDSLGGVNSSTVAAIESIDAALAMESQK